MMAASEGLMSGFVWLSGSLYFLFLISSRILGDERVADREGNVSSLERERI